MRLSPELHANVIANEMKTRLIAKYLKGAAEHGGHIHDLSALQLIEAAMEEAIDQFTYLYTIYEKLAVDALEEEE